MQMNPAHKRKRTDAKEKQPISLEQRQEKCALKYHHAGVEAIRALRKATTFETQKITKRLKKAKDEEDVPELLGRLEAELEAVKSLAIDVLAHYYLQHTIQRSHKDLVEFLKIDQDGEAPHRTEGDSVKNVVGRLFGSKTFRVAIDASINSLKIAAALQPKKPVKLSRSVVPSTAKLAKNTSQMEDASNDKFDVEEQSESGFSSENEHKSGDHQKRKTAEPSSSTTASAFLPTLQSGYLPALDGSDDEAELKGLFPAQKKERKNRRGQRARRKILEAKHGNKAKHVIQAREAAQREYEERVARRAIREAEKTGANAIAIEEAEKNRKERREAKLRPIHSSWAVAKAQKEKLKLAKPEGKKITFE